MENNSILAIMCSTVSMFFYKLGCFNNTKNAESFIVTNSDIEVIDVTPNNGISKHNLHNYLKHHILKTNDEFEPHFPKNPIHIKFKYHNEIYTIYLNKMHSHNTDHLEIIKEPKILFVLFNGENITDNFTKFQGHTRNFYKHIPDVIHDYKTIVNCKEGELNIFDNMGNNNSYKV